ncbi:MAG: adenylate/guanylate cyclase domain-containing protein [Burkholderiaceae bacterium]
MARNLTDADWPLHRRAARTVVVVDVVESVRLMEQNEEDTVHRWQVFVGEAVSRLVPRYAGRLVKSLGDGLMLEFEAVLPAVECAIAMQTAMAKANQGRPADRCMRLRIGAHIADVIVDQHDIYGSGVNLAARLTTLAGPGEIVVSADVRDRLTPDLDAEVEDLGDCHVKHMSRPVRAYRVGAPGVDPVIQHRNTAASELPVIAVIPLTVVASEPSADYFGDIIADDIIGALSTSVNWRVISRLSSAALRDRKVEPTALRDHLNASYVVSGTCRVASSRIRASVELADVRTEMVVWAGTVSDSVSALMAPNGEYTAPIVEQVGAAIFAHELQRARTRPMPTLESYTLLFAAIALMHRLSMRDFERSRGMLQHLVERHPHSPAPRIWMAKWHVMKVAQGWSAHREEEAQLAQAWVRGGLEMQPDHSVGLAIEGLVSGYLFRDLDTAGKRYETALAANPNESLAWLFASARHAYEDRGVEAIASAETALSLSPLDPMRYYYLSFAAHAALAAGQYVEAIDLARRSIKANCTHAPTFRSMTIAQVLSGQVHEARASAGRLLALEPTFTLREFRAQYPGAHSKHARSYFDALKQAGLPQG